jgi:hypothetical protein
VSKTKRDNLSILVNLYMCQEKELFICPLDEAVLGDPVYVLATSMLERGIPEEQLQSELEALGFEFEEQERGY